MKPIYSTIICLFTAVLPATAQYTANKEVGKHKVILDDSLVQENYNSIFPILGKKVVKKGFSLPYSAGLSAQYVWQKSGLTINDLQIGFNDGAKHNLDEIVRFDAATARSSGFNIRPDLWILPFLNVYGILARSSTSTSIDAGIWLPDSTNAYKKITSFSTKAEFQATTLGFGLTPTVGVAGFFVALDMNFTWTDVDALDEPAYIFIFGPRLGKNISLKNGKSSIAMWVGGFRVKMNRGTNGSLPLSDLFSTDELGGKINTGIDKVAASQDQVDAWWNNLSSKEQKNPVNIAKYDAANKVLDKAGNFFNNASEAVSTIENSTVQYSLNKKPEDMWNFIVGAQYQINKSWMIRAEYGFLSSRQQFIGGLQYRFPL